MVKIFKEYSRDSSTLHRLRLIFYFFSLAIIILFTSCNDDAGTDDSGFDREELLDNLGYNVIIPSYKEFRQGVIDLRQRAAEFSQAPGPQTLTTLRSQFKTSYQLWQNCSFYDFGPAKDTGLKPLTNTFPTDPQNIESNITSGFYDLNTPIQRASIGFPAVDYLIYSYPDDELIIRYVDEPGRGTYLADVIDQMLANIDLVLDIWNPNGENYVSTFIALSGKERSSSLSMLINALTNHYENSTLNGKVALPFGADSGNPLPDYVEAFYSRQSIPYLISNVEAIRQLFLGDHGKYMGLGLNDWLNATSASLNNKPMAEAIIDQFDSTLISIARIPDPFSVAVLKSPRNINTAYNEMLTLSQMLRGDMPTALGIQIITSEGSDQ